MGTEVKLRGWLTSAVLGAVISLLAPLSGTAKAAIVRPLLINVAESIVWETPSPFPGSTLTGSSSFRTGVFSDGVFQPTGSFGAQDYNIQFPHDPLIPPGPTQLFLPAVQINWGDTIAWNFDAQHMDPNGASFPTTSCASGVLHPPNPCIPATIATDLVEGFAPIDVSGGIFTFDSAVQVGTWDIRVTGIPEPSSLALLGVGFASVRAFRRWRGARTR